MNKIEARVGQWLDRRSPPRNLTDQQRADMRREILDAVAKAAPSNAVDEWIGELLEKMTLHMKTMSWPAPGIFAQMGVAIYRSAQPLEVAAGPTAVDRFAADVRAGRPVSEHLLFSGRVAGEALRRVLIDFDAVRAYQRSAFLKRKAVHGLPDALRWACSVDKTFGEAMRDEFEPGSGGPEIRAQHAADDDGGFE